LTIFVLFAVRIQFGSNTHRCY